MFSILHITDLHRAKRDPITNSELISALVSDRDMYARESPAVRAPDAIVISGDIIQGVGLGVTDFEHELDAQYETAYEFICELTARFVNGDRSKVIIVPGNHDIDWNTAIAAMSVVPAEKIPKNMPAALYERDSLYRWDWKSRELYIIENIDLYERRLASYWRFFERFYGGVASQPGVKTWADANLFELDDGRIAAVAFNSCHGNDCFNFRGEISREAIGRSFLDLRDQRPRRLRIAIWHHDVEGPPHRADYMDIDIVRGMIARGFRLGLYGHQHRPQITPQRARLLTEETMVIASAGSLCAGGQELPTGALRGYSIVEINDNYDGARIHVREMSLSNSFNKARLRDFEGASFVDLEWSTPTDAAGEPEEPTRAEYVETVRRAEDALYGSGDADTAFSLLLPIAGEKDPFARTLLIESALASGGAERVLQAIKLPTNLRELVLLVDTLLQLDDSVRARLMLSEFSDKLGMSTPVYADLERKIKLAEWSNR